jgi:acetolactate synthase-1/2/3 large subunit
MGVGIASAIGWKLADQDRPVVSITGDGCFFMHGMELLTAKEHNLSVIWVVFNNARLGMVHQGHRLQYGRSHACFTQAPVNIAKMATAMGIRSARVEAIADLDGTLLETWLATPGPAVLEIALVDESIPPMGDRVKFLSSFGHE